MRITDLLDRRSIALDAKPASKKEALDTVIQLMIDSGKIKDAEAYRKEVTAEKKKEQQALAKGWQFLMGKANS